MSWLRRLFQHGPDEVAFGRPVGGDPKADSALRRITCDICEGTGWVIRPAGKYQIDEPVRCRECGGMGYFQLPVDESDVEEAELRGAPTAVPPTAPARAPMPSNDARLDDPADQSAPGAPRPPTPPTPPPPSIRSNPRCPSRGITVFETATTRRRALSVSERGS